MPVPLADFGKNHWTLFFYVVECCAEATSGVARLSKRRFRCNAARHPEHSLDAVAGSYERGTFLRGYWTGDGAGTDESRALADHDDWDCLDDFRAAKLVKIVSRADGIVSLTNAGREVADRLRTHRDAGGNFSRFVA